MAKGTKIAYFFLGFIVLGLLGCGAQNPAQTDNQRGADSSNAMSASSGTNAAGKFQVGSWQDVAVGGFEQVHLYVPKTQSAVGKGRALLIVLHGCLQMPSAFLNANMEAPAEEFGAVVALPNAVYKQGMRCWVFWRRPEMQGTNDYAHIFKMVEELKADPSLGIDPAQVYIAGLSSGGVFAMQSGCLAPDVFAGMGIYAAPSCGIPAHLTMQFTRAGSAEGVAEKCLEYAESRAVHFKTQIMSAATGKEDAITNPGYAPQNANAMALVYGVSPVAGENHIQGGRGATERLWQGNRISLLEIDAMGHNWSAGEGGRGSYVSPNGPNYTRYLLDFFQRNNMRVKR